MSKMIRAIGLALFLAPGVAFSDVVLRGTVLNVDEPNNHLLVKTDRGEETFILDKNTKGIKNAKEGAKVIIKFTEKDGEPKVTEISPQNSGLENPPR